MYEAGLARERIRRAEDLAISEGMIVEVVEGPSGEGAISGPHALDLLLVGAQVEGGI